MTDPIYEFLLDWQVAILQKIENCFSKHDYNLALILTEQAIDNNNFDLKQKADFLFLSTLTGNLIDIGNATKTEYPVDRGIDILHSMNDIYSGIITESSFCYNLANGYSAKFSISRQNKGFYKLEDTEVLQKAKDLYWRAFKAMDEDDSDFYNELQVNLGNCLNTSGRIVESLQFYETVLANSRKFIFASHGRALALNCLRIQSKNYSLNLLYQTLQCYKDAISTKDLPPSFREAAIHNMNFLNEKLTEEGFDFLHADNGVHDTQIEKHSLSSYRNFCLDNHLTLNEHSLYCHCISSQYDNLTIPGAAFPIGGEFVPQMELLLNRLKSEFSFARLLYYQSNSKSLNWDEFDKEVKYTELFEEECLDINFEALRSSYRLCYSILDKIGFGICYMFNCLQSPNENIIFESFWKNRNAPSRWQKLNEMSEKNISLHALYSIATDLNQRNEGEWKHFKEWRNKLEHGIFNIVNDVNGNDLYDVFKDSNFNQKVEAKTFQKMTLQLLQLCRAAIFYYAFCIREEGVKLIDENTKAIKFTLAPKI